MNEWWTEQRYLDWVQFLLASYRRWIGRELIERAGSAAQQANALFDAPFVVVSHDAQVDPLLNYGNRAALDLWETTWEDFCRTPSRLTAEPINRMERARMLAEAHGRGYRSDYRGVRISTSGRRFLVEHACVWNVLDRDGNIIGQAATFAEWKRLD